MERNAPCDLFYCQLVCRVREKTPESTADPAVNQSESTPPEEEIEDTTTLSEINTDFGTLYIPQNTNSF